MHRSVLHVLAVLLLVLPAFALAEEPVDLGIVSRIRDEGFRRSQVLEIARHLTDEIGARVTGSPAMKQANEWTRDKLAAWGLAKARLEPYKFGRGWSWTRGVVQVLRPYETTIAALPKGWTPGTDAGPVRGPLTIVSIESEKDFEQYRGKLAGKILLVGELRDLVNEPREETPRRHSPEAIGELSLYGNPDLADPLESAKRRREMLALRREINRFLHEEKALALLDNSSFDWGILRAGRGGSPDPEEPPGLPSVVISAEEYNRLHRLVAAGREVEAEIDVRARFHTEDLNAYNTIAEIPGTERRGEAVMVGAHLDSTQGGTGAADNAAGCAIVLEAVRILQVIGVKPRRTIRIALWSGEEQGLLGSRAWVAEHLGSRPQPKDEKIRELSSFLWPPSAGPFQARPEHARLSAYFNMDNGGGRIRGIYAQENAAVVPVFEAWIRPLRDLEATVVTMQATDDTDHIPFDAVGIPAFQFIQDNLDYFGRTWHTDQDVYDHLEENDMKQAAVVVATFLYHAAMRPEKLPRKFLR